MEEGIQTGAALQTLREPGVSDMTQAGPLADALGQKHDA